MRALPTVVLAAVLASRAVGAPVVLEPGLKLEEPIVFEQVALYPVTSDDAVLPSADYLTLAAGLERKEVKVREVGQGGEVNKVSVANNSNRPLLLLGGEIILGGQQDRVISQDTLLPPKSTAVVSVFCVEHGRWNGRKDFGRAGGMAEGKLKLSAKRSKNQAEVWDQVAKKTSALGAGSSTGTYATLLEGPKAAQALQRMRAALTPRLDQHPSRARTVGLVAAVNGTVVSADLFANPKLFAEYRGKILDSILITAADAPARPDAPAPPPVAIQSWMKEADQAAEKEEASSATSRTVTKDSAKVFNSQVEPAPVVGAPKGKPVYRSYQTK